MSYVPINIKTNYTFLTSMIKIDDLINYALKNNLKTLTITDNNMFGVLEFYNKCIANNIKPIVGREIELNKLKILLYCANYLGYKNLLKINTILLDEELNLSHLKNHFEGLICIVPFESLKLYDDLKQIYKYIFKSYKNLAEKNLMSGTNLVYMNEILYLKKEQSKYINYLWAIRDGVSKNEINYKKLNYLKLNIEDLENNKKINDLCNLKLKFKQNLFPKFDVSNSDEYLRKACLTGLKEKFGNQVYRIYIDRLNYELDIIKNMNFSNYFLIVNDYMEYAKKNNIMAFARGSSASSLVAYLLNITNVDPIKYNLLFERFLNPKRITIPDIDIDVEHEKRENIINYCVQKYGINKVAPIITFQTMGSKQAIRDVGRALNVKLTNHFLKLIDSNKSLKENYKNPQIKKLISQSIALKEIAEVSFLFEGIKRHSSIHAAGLIISNTNLDNIIPLSKRDDLYLTGYSMDYLEQIGLLKMDILGLKTYTLINNILKDLKINFDKIPLNDKLTFEIFQNSNTIGIFQFESYGMQQFLKKLKPNNIEELIIANALYRPGPMKNIDLYIKRKEGIVPITYLHPSLERILKGTYGIIVYQEQVMQIAFEVAKFDYGKADLLRRAILKKDNSYNEEFINESIRNGYQLEDALKILNLVNEYAEYGFPKAHSTVYAKVAYKMAYLKKHYPNQFYKHLLDSVIGSILKTKEYISDAKINNIEVINPLINESDLNYKITNKIIYPLIGIKNINLNLANLIIKERKKQNFIDIFDFVKRIPINKEALLSLIKAGSFNKFNLTKKTLIENIESILNYGELTYNLDLDYNLKPNLKVFPEYNKRTLLELELESIGLYLSDHPLGQYKRKYNLKNIKNYFDKTIELILYVEGIRAIKTKKGDQMAFITGSDELTSIDIVVFPKLYQTLNSIQLNNIIKVVGSVEKRYNKYNLIAKKIDILE